MVSKWLYGHWILGGMVNFELKNLSDLQVLSWSENNCFSKCFGLSRICLDEIENKDYSLRFEA